jgi:molybdopterin molybdotransferase
VISVEEAVRRISTAVVPLAGEPVRLESAHGRILMSDVLAVRDQPPDAVSAMDGFAVRLADVLKLPVTLRIIGAAPAGHPFGGVVGAGEAVRIFTGGVLPEGADAIVIQEDTDTNGDRVTLLRSASARHIRAARLDFKRGDTLAVASRRLTARDLALLAAGGIPNVDVRRRPVIAFASTGDELAPPEAAQRSGGIVASSGYALAALIRSWGGEPLDLGILPDTIEALQRIPESSVRADVVVTMGGASVGDHDLVQQALAPKGFALDFWKIAMRPGKPLIFGKLSKKPFLGLPGNPVSSYVCAVLFLQPLIAGLLGISFSQRLETVRLANPLHANDSRQDYLRARLFWRDGTRMAEPFAIQDSSMQSALAAADALIVRHPFSPAAHAGESVEVLLLD